MIRFLYFSLYIIAMAVGFVFSAKIRKIWSQRLYRETNSKGVRLGNPTPIWIHASSGEFEYAKPVLKRLKERSQNTLVTYFSPSYSKQVLNSPFVDFAEPLPLDLPGPIENFLNRHNPKELWISRTDLWPEVLRQCRHRKIPVILFSASRAPVTGLKKSFSFLTLWLWNQVDHIYCVSDEDKKNFEDWGVKSPIQVLGDTRYDQVKERLQQNKPLYRLENWRLEYPDTPLLTIGSSWKEDEAVLLPAVQDLLQKDQLRLVIAPHEPTPSHIQALESALTRLDLTHQKSTANETWNTQVLILDQVGVLAEAYSYGNMAFVGGSFKAKVHSVMEPLAAGCPTFVGPYHTNNREALEFQKLGMVIAIQTKDELNKKIKELIDLNQFPRLKTEIKKEIESRTGASDQLLLLKGIH